MATSWSGRWIGELALLERQVLGRRRPPAELAVREALAICGGGVWCTRCGRGLEGRDHERARGASGRAPRCVRCAQAPAFDGFVRLGRYAPPLDALVRNVKARGWHDVAEALGLALAREIDRRLQRPANGWIVTPVPTPFVRRVIRGIDHAQVIAAATAVELGARLAPLLRAPLHAPRQAALGRSERLQRHRRMGVRGCPARLQGASVIVIDDVRTTGGTLQKVRELLKMAGAAAVVPAVICVAEQSQVNESDGFEAAEAEAGAPAP